MALTALQNAGNGAFEAVLGTVSSTAATDHTDVREKHERIYIAAENGASNSCVFTVQGSHDATAWVTLVLEINPSTFAEVTEVTVTAGADDLVFLNPYAVPRFLRVNVTTANANGTTFTLCAER